MSKSEEVPFVVRWRQFEYIPDVLRNNDLLADEMAARIEEVLGNWTKALSLLSAWKDECTVAIRFWARAGSSQVKVFFGYRLENCQANDLRIRAFEFFLSNLLSSIGIKTEASESQSKQVIYRFPTINQRDAVYHISQSLKNRLWEIARTDQQLADQTMRWTFRPFSKPTGSFSEAFRHLFNYTLSQRGDSPLNENDGFACYTAYLRPVELRPRERQWIWNQVQLGTKHAQEVLYHQNESSGTSVDRLLLSASDSFRNFLANLEPAFTCFSEVVVRDADPEVAAINGLLLARAFSAEVNECQKPNGIPGSETEELRSQCQVLEPSTAFADRPPLIEQVNKVARQTFNELRIRHWIGQAIHLDEEAIRIAYLVNPTGAAVLFRLPIDTGKGLPGIPVRQSPPDFDPGDRRTSDSACEAELKSDQKREEASGKQERQITLGELHLGGPIRIPENDLTRHVLIVGNTGSGKTKTTQHLLKQLSVPFLVLETAKKEYRKLADSPDFNKSVNVYTPASEGVVPIRLNPFELLPGVRVESHIGALQTCFEASMPLSGPLFAILEESLVSVYVQLGWRMDEARPSANLRSKPFPTMTLFALTLRVVAEGRGYEGDLKSNITAAISGRISPLTLGSGTSRGKMLDCYVSSPPIEQLFTESTVLELNDLRAEEKALVTMFIMVFLREHREVEQQTCPHLKGIKHITVIEEAHNVLASQSPKSGEESPNTRNAAVERFSNMLTEMRSLGEGIVIADQSPHKILPDAIRNTNLQIVHQLRAKDDREAVAASMVMSSEQEEFLAKLRTGNAAIFFSGLERATFVKIPNIKETDSDLNSDDSLRSLMAFRHPGNGLLWDFERRWPFRGCIFCPEKEICPVREQGNQIASLENDQMPSLLQLSLGKFDAPADVYEKFVKLTLAFHRRLQALSIPNQKSLFWCTMTHALSRVAQRLASSDFDPLSLETLGVMLAFQEHIFDEVQKQQLS